MNNPWQHHLRPATQADFELVRKLHHETLKEYIRLTYGWDEFIQDSFITDWFNPEKIQIIQVGAEDAGLLLIELKEDHIFFESISLFPQFQNHGIGRAIIQAVLRDAAIKRLPVHLQVLKPNPAKRLYERMGFAVDSEDEEHFYMSKQ